MKTIKVLHINATSQVFGGVSSFCLNIYRRINKDKVQFDFLTPNISTYKQYQTEIEEMGGHIYDFAIDASKYRGKIKLYFRLKSFLQNTEYDIIHINSGVLLFNCVVAAACKKISHAKIIVHSHSNGGRSKNKECFSEPLKRYLGRKADITLACSKSAAEYMFAKEIASKTTVIKNGIDVNKFKYDSVARDRIRKELNLSDNYIIGHVGRFTEEKNHVFLINVFAEIKKNRKGAILLLIGEGRLEKEIHEMVEKLGLKNSVLFLGARTDVSELYQAMDVFALPSLFEGFGIVCLEAQASGLKCVVSDGVPKEVNITGNVDRLSLNDPVVRWAKQLCTVSGKREGKEQQVKAAGFDIIQSARQLEEIYERLLA